MQLGLGAAALAIPVQRLFQRRCCKDSLCCDGKDATPVGPFLMEGFGLMKSFREIIQNQLLFEGFGIMKSFGDRNLKK